MVAALQPDTILDIVNRVMSDEIPQLEFDNLTTVSRPAYYAIVRSFLKDELDRNKEELNTLPVGIDDILAFLSDSDLFYYVETIMKATTVGQSSSNLNQRAMLDSLLRVYLARKCLRIVDPHFVAIDETDMLFLDTADLFYFIRKFVMIIASNDTKQISEALCDLETSLMRNFFGHTSFVTLFDNNLKTPENVAQEHMVWLEIYGYSDEYEDLLSFLEFLQEHKFSESEVIGTLNSIWIYAHLFNCIYGERNGKPIGQAVHDYIERIRKVLMHKIDLACHDVDFITPRATIMEMFCQFNYLKKSYDGLLPQGMMVESEG